MGRDKYWGGSKSWWRGGGGGSRGGGGDGGREEGDSASTPTGCMCAVFQLFDFHQIQFSLHQQSSFKSTSFLSEEPPVPKGAEAPRNSLELEEPPLPSGVKEDNLTIRMGIQIKTKGAPTDSSSSEISSSPGAKTPNLVARLMGLDILPDDQTYSPRVSSSSNLGPTNPDGIESHIDHHFRPRQALQSKTVIYRSSLYSHDFTGSRSLPETPRISSDRRSEVGHRLSLQINKENMSTSEEAMLSRISSLRRKGLKADEENRSPGHHARHIVKQVKASVSRKVGLDITNTVRNREQRSSSREEIVSQFKSKKISKALGKVVDDLSLESHSISSNCSPRLKFLEAKHKPTVPSLDHNISQLPKLSLSTSSHVDKQSDKAPTKPKLQPIAEDQQRRPIKTKCKRGAEEKFSPSTTRLKKPPQTSDMVRNKQEEPFVRATSATGTNVSEKKCKKTPLSNNLLPVKKDPAPPATKIPQKQLSSCSSQSSSYNQQPVFLGARDSCKDNNPHQSNGRTATTRDGAAAAAAAAAAAEYECYITRILRRTGIEKDAPVASCTSWFSPSHPLDPSIFHQLELQLPTNNNNNNNNNNNASQLNQRCNRKLLFHLVDEILSGILGPYMNFKPWAAGSSIKHHHGHGHGHITKGSHLVHVLCSKVASFPCADCRVLEDIDALIDKDLSHHHQLKVQSELAFEEERESLVTDIEKDILDTLIHETAVVLGGRTGVLQRWNGVSFFCFF